MPNWFRKRQTVAAHGHAPMAPVVGEADLKAAYERGRIDEKKRHRRSPVLAIALVAVALVGGASLVLAAKEGSFRDGGAVMDSGARVAVREAVPTLKKGVDEAGQGLKKVQDKLSSSSTQQQPS